MSEWPLLAGLGVAVFLGTATQRITGMGFALVASPFLVALLGPFEGVLVVNVFGLITAAVVFLRVFREVEYRRALLLLVPATIAAIPGAIVARTVSPPLLMIIVGGLLIVALVGSLVVRNRRLFGGKRGAVAAGFVSGFMNVTAGVGGPAISAYAIASRWPQRAFAATAQLYFCVLGGVSLLAKWSLPRLDPPQWAACAAAVICGVIVGELLSRWVSPRAARAFVVVIAFAGALLILVKGIVEIVPAP
ncbi:sulfite exporter TauE/SafE family protein [Microbacterium sp. No. 7]|uniref:sulfite exporter TauE/SafE family protein n=1 Tax=Microbacterium sp. No. 7 TaxID=1714373 RepID=UPI0006D15EE6|nr:sulfite exporter TauE/SafE family protein [Microbacterium sp. No. 7]ALJ21981.1 hypothetical protein AOA12_19625 [Microbacterium sp. No. 7]